MRKRNDMDIDQVAVKINDSMWWMDYSSAGEYARDQNRAEGWGFDVCYGGEGPGNWTRVEGLRLSDEDLEVAVLLAEDLRAGKYYTTIAQARKRLAGKAEA